VGEVIVAQLEVELPDLLLELFVCGLSDKLLLDGDEARVVERVLRWVRQVRDYADTLMSDQVYETIKLRSDHRNTPTTKEEALYRHIFWDIYHTDKDHLITEIWRPKWTCVTDPSARKLD